MPSKIMLCVLALAVSSTACGQSLTEKAEKDELYFAKKDDKDMELAYRQAKDGLEDFLATSRNPPSGHSDFSVKIGITEGDDTEYFWVSPFREQAGSFVGTLNNEPRMVTSVQLGQEINFSRDQIVDWLYHHNGKMVGNFTACAMLKSEPEAERQAFERRFGLRCGA